MVNTGLLGGRPAVQSTMGGPGKPIKPAVPGCPGVRHDDRHDDGAMMGILAGQPRAPGFPSQDHHSGTLRRVEASPESPPPERELPLRLQPALSTVAEAG